METGQNPFSRHLAISVCAAILAGCGGSGGVDPDGTVLPVPSGPEGLEILGNTFSGDAMGMAFDDSGTLSADQRFSVNFLDEALAIITIDGRSTLLSFDGISRYDSDDGLASIFFSKGPVDGVIDADVVALTIVDQNAPDDLQNLYNFITGNNTDAENVPTFGVVSFTGNGQFWDKDANVSVATITLNANFGGDLVVGSISQGIPGIPSARLLIDPGPIAGAGFSGTISGDGFAATGEYDGGFFGTTASTAAATANASTEFGNVTGRFIVTR